MVASTDVSVGGVYREASVVELVPLPPARRPWGGSGLRIHDKNARLDVSIGSDLSLAHVGFAVLAPVVATFYLLVSMMFLHELPLWIGILLWTVYLAWFVRWSFERQFRKQHDRIRLTADALVVEQVRPRAPIETRTIELSRIVRVHDAGAQIGLELDEGTQITIGERLRVPRRVIRWLAGRIAQLLPPAAERVHALPAGSEGRDEERQLCPDEACIGIVGADGRCKVCGRAAQAAPGT